MTILAVAGEIAMIGWILFFGWFAVISLREKEKRAFLRSAFCCLSLILSGLLFFLSPFPFQRILFSGLAVFSMIFFCSMFFTSSPKKGIEIFGNQVQVDERDVIFARFDLEKGTEHYKAYYDNRRDLASIDREIRQMPDLFSESHNIKDPGLFALAAAEFDFLEHQLTWVDGKTNEPKAKLSVEGNTRLVKQAVQYLGSDLCGIAPLNKSYVYSHTGRGPDPYGQEIVLDHKFAILFAVEMDTAMVSAAPKAPVVAET